MGRYNFLRFCALSINLWVMCVSSMPATTHTGIIKSTEKSPSVFALDIESCICKLSSSKCEVAISSSLFSEIKCAEGEHFCCSVAKNVARPNTIGDLSKQEDTRVNATEPKVRIVAPSRPLISDPVGLPKKPETRTRCSCRLRDKCEQKYIDYSFSFQCSYDQVRCCDPTDPTPDPEYTTDGNGRIINVLSNPGNEKLSKSCKCLPQTQCNINTDVALKRNDLLCPKNLVQCCGEAIAEKKSDSDDSLDEPVETTRSGHYSPAPVENSTDNRHLTQSQPIPIPLMKIPPPREAPVEIITSTLPPPQLPVQYFHSPTNPQYFNRYYSPVQPQYVQPSTSYLSNGRPYSYAPRNRFVINQNGRGLTETQRAAGSFFSNLATYLG